MIGGSPSDQTLITYVVVLGEDFFKVAKDIGKLLPFGHLQNIEILAHSITQLDLPIDSMLFCLCFLLLYSMAGYTIQYSKKPKPVRCAAYA